MEKEKYRSIAEAVMILGLVVLGGMELTEDKAMYCESRGIALNCDKTTATRCYYEDTYKVCKEGWKPLKDLVEIETEETSVKVTANGGNFICQTDEGVITSYTRCIKENGQEGYLGELI